MVIHDWQKTPIYHILMRDMPIDRAIIRFCNKASLDRLANELRERIDIQEKAEARAKEAYDATLWHNPADVADSDSSGPDDHTQEHIQ